MIRLMGSETLFSDSMGQYVWGFHYLFNWKIPVSKILLINNFFDLNYWPPNGQTTMSKLNDKWYMFGNLMDININITILGSGRVALRDNIVGYPSQFS